MTTQQTKSITQEKHQDSDGGAQQQWNKHDIMTTNIKNIGKTSTWQWQWPTTMKQSQWHNDQQQKHEKKIDGDP
jgi:hypothetical protein